MGGRLGQGRWEPSSPPALVTIPLLSAFFLGGSDIKKTPTGGTRPQEVEMQHNNNDCGSGYGKGSRDSNNVPMTIIPLKMAKTTIMMTTKEE
jgi:hypothetical protein